MKEVTALWVMFNVLVMTVCLLIAVYIVLRLDNVVDATVFVSLLVILYLFRGRD